MYKRRVLRRGVAQPGSASVLGTEGRKFESCLPDHFPSQIETVSKYFLIPFIVKRP